MAFPVASCDCCAGLPDENGRVEILNIHTSLMKKHNKLAEDVDIEDLAKKTRNFSGAELEGLVRSAQATAMNKLIKVCYLLAEGLVGVRTLAHFPLLTLFPLSTLLSFLTHPPLPLLSYPLPVFFTPSPSLTLPSLSLPLHPLSPFLLVPPRLLYRPKTR